LANSKLSFTVAGLIAGRLGGVSTASRSLLRRAFEAVLGRPPSAEELGLSEKFLAQEEERFRGPEKTGVAGVSNQRSHVTRLACARGSGPRSTESQ